MSEANAAAAVIAGEVWVANTSAPPWQEVYMSLKLSRNVSGSYQEEVGSYGAAPSLDFGGGQGRAIQLPVLPR